MHHELNRLRLFGTLWLFAAFVSYGQVESVHHRFSVPYARGCSPFTVHLQEHDSLGNIARTYVYEPGATETSDTFYTYTQPGIFQIVQLVGIDVIPKFDTLTVEVLAPKPPLYEYSYCDTNQVFFSLKDDYYDSFRIKSSVDSLVFSRGMTREFVLNTGIDPQVTIQGFFDHAEANCGEYTVGINPQLPANDLVIRDFNINYECDDQVSLSVYYQSNPHHYYEVLLDTLILYRGILPADSISFSGIAWQSGTDQACMAIRTLSPCTNTTLFEKTSCKSFPGGISGIENAYSTYQGTDIRIFFTPSGQGKFELKKWTGNTLLATFDNIKSGFTDVSVYNTRQYHYVLAFVPDCGSAAQSVDLSPPHLRAKRLDINRYRVSWDSATMSANLSSAYVFTIEGAGTSASTPVNSHTFDTNLVSEYGISQIVKVQTADSVIQSNELILPFEHIVYIPDAFTPNDDGLNDRLELFGLPTEKFSLKIFNKWGEMVFETNDQNKMWDGRLKNRHIVEGVYVYSLEFYDQEGELYHQRGSFVVLRK